MFNRNNVKTVAAFVPSIASDATLMAPFFMAPDKCELTALRVISAGATLSTNANLNIYKNASDAGSRLSTTGSLASYASFTGSTLTMVTTVSLRRLTAGDILLYEFTSHGGTTTNYRIEADYIYGYTNA